MDEANGMRVFLTGGTGLIGSGVLAALLAAGNRVTALARSDASAEALAAAGADPLRGDLDDREVLAAAARDADAVVHAGSPGDASSARVDVGVVDTVLAALRGTGKAYLHTSGVWVYGDGELTEDTPVDPGALSAWRQPLNDRVRSAAADGVRGVVIAPGIVYGRGGGIPRLVRSGPRAEDGALRLPGRGEQRWTTVHTADLGRLYALALAHAAPGTYYLAASGDNPTVREIGAAASVGAGGDGRVVGSSPEESRSLYGPIAAGLLLDQRATGDRARAELGWRPTAPTLLEDLACGSYAG